MCINIPFFLQSKPALATGRGEKIQSLDFFPALRGAAFILVYAGFGISTAWAYQQLGRFPEALNGKSGRAERLIRALQTSDLPRARREFYNSLEAPAFHKFPLLQLIQEFFRENGALAALMSGSGSTSFAIAPDLAAAQKIEGKIREEFGQVWMAVVGI